MKKAFAKLKRDLAGELYLDDLHRLLYATDASVYREKPMAVVIPKNDADLEAVISFANLYDCSLIPRSGGTSLAGQCVGPGIVVDASKYLNQVLELNAEENWVSVQPGVIRDELNAYLEPYGKFFGPDTATANRCMIGGMVGNNSCGTHSIVYGSTRNHVIYIQAFMSDASSVCFEALSPGNYLNKLVGSSLENEIYRQIDRELRNPKVLEAINLEFPRPEITRRNTGYAVDELLKLHPFNGQGEAFNLAKMVCGSEGTLAFTREVKLNLVPLPGKGQIVVVAHFKSIAAALRFVGPAMEHKPTACELLDKIVLDCTKMIREQQKNRFFIQGDPAAVLLIEFRAETQAEAKIKGEIFIEKMKGHTEAYALPVISPPLTMNVWALRKAGLGSLSNLPGDAKPIACIEDTAVALEDLPSYIEDFSKMMEEFGQSTVYYAHAGAGELHLRPILNLKESNDIRLFREISEETAKLVKKYRGSLSGEHGDGRVRSPFLPMMIGPVNYELLKRIKRTWDPKGIFNPGKITNALPIDSSLRYSGIRRSGAIATVINFDQQGGILAAAEKCNGSGDCRKLPLSGGTMCPSYQATRNEKDTTRARANALREYLSQPDRKNPFDHNALYKVLELCISCKGCTSECPSGVDMASMKAEFLHHFYKAGGMPFREKMMGTAGKRLQTMSKLPWLANLISNGSISGPIVKKILGISRHRKLPKISSPTLREWHNTRPANLGSEKPEEKTVYFFCDEFTNYLDAETGIHAISLLEKLGYRIEMPLHPNSGRSEISKGMLTEAKLIAEGNVRIFSSIISKESPLIGIEPSAILGFRDEYPRLVDASDRDLAERLGKNCLTFEEFIIREFEAGLIKKESFIKDEKRIALHAHCHQKALGSAQSSAMVLSIPENYSVELIPSGCCGMAGSFGMEEEHYDLSMNIGELVLFPYLRKYNGSLVSAPGTSCRHQILDGTGHLALHPASILFEALV